MLWENTLRTQGIDGGANAVNVILRRCRHIAHGRVEESAFPTKRETESFFPLGKKCSELP